MSQKYTLTQKPNAPIYLAIALWLASFIFKDKFALALIDLSFVSVLLFWAYLEVISGANNFRKFLGAAVGGYMVYRLITILL